MFIAANHLNYLGVEIAWITGPWFLSIFVNMLPWESGQVSFHTSENFQIRHMYLSHMEKHITVLRVWDVILFEGNRTMLFRTALSVMELYGIH